MRFKVEGVDAETGKSLKSILIEAENELDAAKLAKHQGVIASKIKEYIEPPKPTARKKIAVYAPWHPAPLLLSVIGILFWVIALGSIAENTLSAGAWGISGSIFLVDAIVVSSINRSNRA